MTKARTPFLLFLVLWAHPAAAQPDPLHLSPLRSGELVVWVSSEPHLYSSEIKSSFALDFPNAKLIETQIPSATFVDQVTAGSSQQPDLAFIGNYLQLKPLLEKGIVWFAWGMPRFRTGGWWVIFKRTQRLPQAHAFVRWLAELPDWQPRTPRTLSPTLPTGAADVLQSSAITALDAIMRSDQNAIESLLDKDAARTRLTPIPAVIAVFFPIRMTGRN